MGKGNSLNAGNDWGTPKAFYEVLNERYKFDFDPCPLRHDLSKWDGLEVDWGEKNFVNPPYDRKNKEAFVKKAIEESKKGKLCVLLIPVSTSSKLFHDHIKPNAKTIEFVRGRIKFEGYDTKGNKANDNGTFDNMIVVFDGSAGQQTFNFCHLI